MSEYKVIAGIDDATKCPIIGSIFIAGVVADEKTIKKWKKLGVNDSKLIAAKKREKLAKIIKETAIGFVIREVTPQMIDDKSFNLNAWEMIVVLKIAAKLQKVGDPEAVYVDNWETTETGFRERFKSLTDVSLKEKLLEKNIRFNKKLSAINFIPEHQADENHVIVGAASILAKTSSDAQYRKYKKKYGDFGSGSPGDPKTRLFVWQHRENPLPIIRTSWVTYKTLARLSAIEQDEIYSRIKKNKSLTAANILT